MASLCGGAERDKEEQYIGSTSMIGQALSAVLVGAEVIPIGVEAHTHLGKPKFHLIGLGDVAVREARERILSALHAEKFRIPDQILLNLAPADVKKSGSALELAMAWAILVSSEQCTFLEDTWMFGELSLEGEIKPVRGVAAITSYAVSKGVRRIVVPFENREEALLVDGIEVFAVKSLSHLISVLSEGVAEKRSKPKPMTCSPQRSFGDVYGQEGAKRALEIAACGGHNVLLVGPPGCGKSMLAERFGSLLPPLERGEALEIARIASSIGEPITEYLSGRRPFRSPHHGISEAGLIGGGADLRPGEVSLSHCGVLFLDELPEFRRGTLESLRAPLETRKVSITRVAGTTTYPAAFQLIAAMNPCPCGKFSSEQQGCRCSRSEVARYLKKLSQPILERIDLHVEATPVSLGIQPSSAEEETLQEREKVRRERVLHGVALQSKRQSTRNATLSFDELKPYLTPQSEKFLLLLTKKNLLSARSAVRLLRTARTIADLAVSEVIAEEHLHEARSYRALDKIWEQVQCF